MDSSIKKISNNYAILALPIAYFALTFTVTFPEKISQNTPLSLTSVGFFLLLVRIWDGFSDPAIGYLSDHFPSKLATPRIRWMKWGGALYFFSFLTLYLYTVDSHLSTLLKESAVYTVPIVLFFFYTGWSCLVVPYETIPTGLEEKFRSLCIQKREAMILIGTIAAIISSAVFPKFELYICCSLGILLFFAINNISNLPQESSKMRQSSISEIKNVFSHKPFRTLLINYALLSFSSMIPVAVIVQYTKYVLGFSPGEILLLAYLLVGLISLPVWKKLLDTYPPRTLYQIAIIIYAGAFLFATLLQKGDIALYLGIIALSGFGFGGTLILPNIFQTEIVTQYALLHGGGIEGVMMGFWTFIKKTCSAIGAAFAILLVGLSGINPKLEIQTDYSIALVAFIYAGLPSFFALLSGFFIPIISHPKKSIIMENQ